VPAGRLAVLVVAILVATSAMPVASSGKAAEAFDSKVTLKPDNPFHGRVISEKPACERGRTVQVFDKQPGTDGLYGATETDAEGRWSMPASPNGDFYAKVKRKVGPAGTTFSCRPDLSPVRTF
jgi:hypothetical protein